MDILLAEYALQESAGALTSDDVVLPDGFPTARLVMPRYALAPDYFEYSAYTIVSSRMMDAMAQPKDIVQFVPVDLVRGGKEARAQNYHLMRVLAQQPAMDLERSKCTLEDFTNPITGVRSKRPDDIETFVPLAGLQPRTEIFRVEESPTDVLATDDLAARVLRAGCTGVEFADPANRQGGKRIERYRTVDGIAERKVGFLED